MTTSSVTMYSTPICGYCGAAKRLLQSEGISYEEIDLSRDQDLRFKLVEQTGWRTVPMIFIGEDFVGGYQELNALRKEGGLEHLKTST
jgi:glutaredoxin 3